MIEQAFLLSPDRIERLEQLNSENGLILELLGFVRTYEDEVRRLKDESWKAISEIVQSENKALHDQVKELQKALEWYADRLNYSGPHSAVWQDEGNQARETLERSKP